MNQTKTYITEDFDTEVLIDNDGGCQLVVWNDEVNSFDWVITTLSGNMRPLRLSRLNNVP